MVANLVADTHKLVAHIVANPGLRPGSQQDKVMEIGHYTHNVAC